jgi:hypothetical protein
MSNIPKKDLKIFSSRLFRGATGKGNLGRDWWMSKVVSLTVLDDVPEKVSLGNATPREPIVYLRTLFWRHAWTGTDTSLYVCPWRFRRCAFLCLPFAEGQQKIGHSSWRSTLFCNFFSNQHSIKQGCTVTNSQADWLGRTSPGHGLSILLPYLQEDNGQSSSASRSSPPLAFPLKSDSLLPKSLSWWTFQRKAPGRDQKRAAPRTV